MKKMANGFLPKKESPLMVQVGTNWNKSWMILTNNLMRNSNERLFYALLCSKIYDWATI